jgi:hypothetical protein
MASLSRAMNSSRLSCLMMPLPSLSSRSPTTEPKGRFRGRCSSWMLAIQLGTCATVCRVMRPRLSSMATWRCCVRSQQTRSARPPNRQTYCRARSSRS